MQFESTAGDGQCISPIPADYRSVRVSFHSSDDDMAPSGLRGASQ